MPRTATITGATLQIADTGGGPISAYNLHNLVSIEPIYKANANNISEGEKYKYTNLTILTLHFNHGTSNSLRIELQDISNQATWSTGNVAGLNAAVGDFTTAINLL